MIVTNLFNINISYSYLKEKDVKFVHFLCHYIFCLLMNLNILHV